MSVKNRQGMGVAVTAGLAMVAASAVNAAVVAQCERTGVAADGQGLVTAWDSLGGGTAFAPLFASSPVWTLPALEPGGVAFDAGDGLPASPLASGLAAVSTLFLVVDPAPAGDRFAALVEAPGASVTVAPHAEPPTYDPEDAAGLSVCVNGADSPGFPAARHIVEVDFPQPVTGGALRVGGASACAGWDQVWRGRVLTVIAFDEPPGEPVRKVVRSMLARFHGIPGNFPPPGREAVLQAVGQGLNTHGLFATVMILK